MKKVHRKLRLFKNDPFGMKEKYFGFRLKHCLRKGVEIRTRALRVYLKKVIKRFDETIVELEENLKYARMYIQEESEGKDNE